MNALFFIQNIGLGAGLAMDACAVSMSNGLKEPKMRIVKLLVIAGMFGLFQALMPIIGYFAGHALLDYIGVAIPWLALGLLTVLGGKMIIEGIRDSRAAKAAPTEIERAPEPSDIAAVEPSSETGEVVKPCENPHGGIAVETDEVVKPCENTHGGAAVEADEVVKPCENPHGSVAVKRLTAGALLVQAIATSIDALSVGLTIADYTIPMAFVAALIIAAVTFCICVPAVFIGKKFGDKLGSKAIILGGVILVAIGLEICLTGVL